MGTREANPRQAGQRQSYKAEELAQAYQRFAEKNKDKAGEMSREEKRAAFSQELGENAPGNMERLYNAGMIVYAKQKFKSMQHRTRDTFIEESGMPKEEARAFYDAVAGDLHKKLSNPMLGRHVDKSSRIDVSIENPGQAREAVAAYVREGATRTVTTGEQMGDLVDPAQQSDQDFYKSVILDVRDSGQYKNPTDLIESMKNFADSSNNSQMLNDHIEQSRETIGEAWVDAEKEVQTRRFLRGMECMLGGGKRLMTDAEMRANIQQAGGSQEYLDGLVQKAQESGQYQSEVQFKNACTNFCTHRINKPIEYGMSTEMHSEMIYDSWDRVSSSQSQGELVPKQPDQVIVESPNRETTSAAKVETIDVTASPVRQTGETTVSDADLMTALNDHTNGGCLERNIVDRGREIFRTKINGGRMLDAMNVDSSEMTEANPAALEIERLTANNAATLRGTPKRALDEGTVDQIWGDLDQQMQSSILQNYQPDSRPGLVDPQERERQQKRDFVEFLHDVQSQSDEIKLSRPQDATVGFIDNAWNDQSNSGIVHRTIRDENPRRGGPVHVDIPIEGRFVLDSLTGEGETTTDVARDFTRACNEWGQTLSENNLSEIPPEEFKNVIADIPPERVAQFRKNFKPDVPVWANEQQIEQAQDQALCQFVGDTWRHIQTHRDAEVVEPAAAQSTVTQPREEAQPTPTPEPVLTGQMNQPRLTFEGDNAGQPSTIPFPGAATVNAASRTVHTDFTAAEVAAVASEEGPDSFMSTVNNVRDRDGSQGTVTNQEIYDTLFQEDGRNSNIADVVSTHAGVLSKPFEEMREDPGLRDMARDVASIMNEPGEGQDPEVVGLTGMQFLKQYYERMALRRETEGNRQEAA